MTARHAEQFEDKVAIARRLIAEIPEDGVVILDSGSLTFVCAQVLPTDPALVVVTNNLPAPRMLADHDNLWIMRLPGTIRGLTSAAVDPWTSRRLGMSADLAIIGVNGLTSSDGLTTTNPEEAAAKRATRQAARRRVLPVTGKTRLELRLLLRRPIEVDLIITDEHATPDLVREFRAVGPGGRCRAELKGVLDASE